MTDDFVVVVTSWEGNGFLGKLKAGEFDRISYNLLRDAMLRLKIADYVFFEKEFVRSIWFIPIFMARQKEYLSNINSREYDALIEEIVDLLAGIFGYP